VLGGIGVRSTQGPLRAHLSFVLPAVLVRPVFTIDGHGDVYRTAPVGFRTVLGADFSTP
jgi:hypothetical protein